MIGILILSHGDMAKGMIHSIGFLQGEAKGLSALCLYPEQSPEEFDKELLKAAAEVDEGDGILIFTDIKGGTPSNRALLLAGSRPDVEVFAGVNLPLVLAALDARDSTDLLGLCEELNDIASITIAHTSLTLRKLTAEAGDDMDDLME